MRCARFPSFKFNSFYVIIPSKHYAEGLARTGS